MTPRFTEDDERGYTLIPVGKYPTRIEQVTLAAKPDSQNRDFYKAEFVLLSPKELEGVPVTVNLSEHWMKHLMIHLMRAIGMMNVMVVDPMFRSDPQDFQSFDMEAIVANLPDCKVGIVIEHSTSSKDGKTYTNHNVKDFYPLVKKDGSAVGQPAWKQVASKPKMTNCPDNPDDIDMTEDSEFLD